MRNGSNKPEGEEETEATEVPQVSATFQEVPQVSDAFQNVPYKTKTETKTKSENMQYTLRVAQTRRTARPKLTNHSR